MDPKKRRLWERGMGRTIKSIRKYTMYSIYQVDPSSFSKKKTVVFPAITLIQKDQAFAVKEICFSCFFTVVHSAKLVCCDLCLIQKLIQGQDYVLIHVRKFCEYLRQAIIRMNNRFCKQRNLFHIVQGSRETNPRVRFPCMVPLLD